jgi:dienelactone hydrolase
MRRPFADAQAPSIAEAVAAYGWPPKADALAPDPRIAPQSWGPALAPDARQLAFVSDESGAPRAYVVDLALASAATDGQGASPAAGLAALGPPRALPTGGEPVVELAWSPDGRWIACTIAPGGSERHEIWVIRPDGTDLRLAAGAAHGTAMFCRWSRHSGRLAVTHATGARERRASLVEPATGSATTIAGGELVLLADVDGEELCLLLRRGPRSAHWITIASMHGEERALFGAGAAADGGEGGSAEQAEFAADAGVAYVRSDLGCARSVLYAVALAVPTSREPVQHGGSPAPAPKIVAARDDAELENFVVSCDRRVWVLLWNLRGGRSALGVFDPERGCERPLPGPPGDVFSDLSLSSDGAWLALTAQGPAQPRDVWLIELASGRICRATETDPGPHTLVQLAAGPALHAFRAADGLELTGWLYRAAGVEGPGPVVIHLHGGPEAQERPVWNPLYAQLLERGLSVFAPNVRGSSGFGRAFLHADGRERRYAAIEDVCACAQYLLDRSIAEAGRIGCMGRSYGGYLTLAALVHQPQLFAVGVDMCGMADLLTFYERTERWIAAQAVSKYGDPLHDRELLHDLSPLHRFDRLSAPLLVVHGAHDSNVPLFEAEQVVRALALRGLPGGFLLFSDEGHELLQHANQAKYIRVVSDWLEHHLRR